MEQLTSLKNPKVMSWRSLKDRKGREAAGCFLVEGRKMVGEALASGFRVETLLIRENTDPDISTQSDIPVYCLPPHVFDAVCETRTPQGIAAVVRIAPRPASGPRLIVLDQVQDPGNVGTILRTMDAAGFDTLYIDEKTADPFSPKCSRATMGAIFRIRIERCSTLEEPLARLKRADVPVISGDLRGSDLFARPSLRGKGACLLIGNEGSGIEPDIKALSDLCVRIPMPGGAESLNASVSAGILIYDLLREALE